MSVLFAISYQLRLPADTLHGCRERRRGKGASWRAEVGRGEKSDFFSVLLATTEIDQDPPSTVMPAEQHTLRSLDAARVALIANRAGGSLVTLVMRKESI